MVSRLVLMTAFDASCLVRSAKEALGNDDFHP
jgi:hypothetical protein